ncbi:D-alanyl-D-alanine endopeptidase [Oryzomicrobium sp.]|uniref:D-alanyl-D-alanine endopeptidase n=1 Tax=Oryzomicrobium sp. TaxID=1911578 RepID=UPI0025EFF2BE|nr:D-alanyl-D-alanine endopeptidase [Oryzomicrobium sp.]MCE1244421.1 D-alanyl-D-alanine endopeptidase [Oryzomicrobium sp.]
MPAPSLRAWLCTSLMVSVAALATPAAVLAAAADKAPTHATKKKAKPAAKSTAAAKPKAVKASAKAPAAKPAVRKHVHKVSMADPNDWVGSTRALGLQSSAALVQDLTTGELVFEKNAGTVVPIASITKLMTAMVALDAQPNLNEILTISEEDVDTLKGSRSRLHVGTQLSREQALLLALMSSENRAAHSLSRHYPGGTPAFVAAMNRKAQALGMTHTRFEDPTGLTANNVSTARDLAKMVSAAHHYPLIREFSTTPGSTVELGGRPMAFNNTNALVKSDSWEIGLSKTGFIQEAGKCLVMQAHVAGRPVAIVLLDSSGKLTRIGDANRIKRWMESSAGKATRA